MLTSQLVQVAALIGVLLPLLIAALTKTAWSANVKAIIAFGISLAAAVVVALADATLNWHNWVACVFVIYVLAQTTYQNIWKPTGVSEWISLLTDFKIGSVGK